MREFVVLVRGVIRVISVVFVGCIAGLSNLPSTKPSTKPSAHQEYKPRVNPLNLEAHAARCAHGVCTL